MTDPSASADIRVRGWARRHPVSVARSTSRMPRPWRHRSTAPVANVAEVVIDLTAIDFIDSRGLRLLERLSTAAAERDASSPLSPRLSSIARSVLDMTRMSDELAVQDSAQIAES